RAHDDEQEEGGQHNFCDQGSVTAVVVGRMLAKAVGGKACYGIKARFAAGDQVQNAAGQQAADNLGNDVGNGIASGETSASNQAQRDSRVDVATGDIAGGIAHGQQGQTRGQGYPGKTNPQCRIGSGKGRTSAAPKDQPESA